MANIDYTTLWSDSPEEFDKITKGLTFQRCRDVEREPGKMFIRTAWGVPHEEIKALSAKHPGIKFTAKHSFEHNRYDEIFTVEYQAGEEKVVNVEPGYMWDDVRWAKDVVPCLKELEAKFEEVCRRLDVTKEDAEHGLFLDWVNAEVNITVQHEGFKMSATKNTSEVSGVRFFKAEQITRWHELDKQLGDDDIPF